VVLSAFGLARRGYFKGDLFIAAAVVSCAALLALFIVYPVLKALGSAFVGEEGGWSPLALWERVASARNFSLSCVLGGLRCGVAWNTLFLGLMTATSTVLLGTLMALLAERTGKRMARSLNALALLPIITPPFVVGLGLILLLGRAGLVNQLLEYTLGVTPSRWFYGWFGVWVAQTFAFAPIAFMIMRGVVQGIAPSLEEAAQTLRASPAQTFMSITLPLLKPGLANAFLVGFIESMADFGNPIVVGGQFSVLSTEIFFAIVGAQYDQGRAASLAWIELLRAQRIRIAALHPGAPELHHGWRQGRWRHRHGLADKRSARDLRHRLAVDGVYGVGLRFCLRRRFRQDLGPRLHADAGTFSDHLCAGVDAVWSGLGRHGLEFTLYHAQAGRPVGTVDSGPGPFDCLPAGAHPVQGAGFV
jgi:ABC-type spermidine/putrescine transport system permease subunit II